MKKLMTEWRKHLNEMISTRELEDFDAKYKNPESVQILASELLDLGWAREAVEHHKTEIPPFSEIRNVILNLEKYDAPKTAEVVNADELFVSGDNMRDREQKYQDYKSGKIDRYFRDSDKDPDGIDFANLPPVTAVEEPDGRLEVADGNHRVFLAKKSGASVPAWIIRLKK